MSTARSGDQVRALTGEGGKPVEGVLVLRYVPALDYVQVLAAQKDGDAVPVVPDSVEVVTTQVATPEELERDDPLRGDEGWRPVRDMDEARRIGCYEPEPKSDDWWDALDTWMDRALKPLVDAGWVMGDRFREESWEFGDSVACFLGRGDEGVNPELYDDHSLALWEVYDEDGEEITDGAQRGVEWVDADASLDELARQYRKLGYLP